MCVAMSDIVSQAVCFNELNASSVRASGNSIEMHVPVGRDVDAPGLQDICMLIEQFYVANVTRMLLAASKVTQRSQDSRQRVPSRYSRRPDCCLNHASAFAM